jgi:hypothetical protein
LEHAKSAVLNSLTSTSGQRTYKSRHSRVRCLVLLGTAPGVQPDGGAPLAHSSRTTRVCTCHHQPSASRSPSCGV